VPVTLSIILDKAMTSMKDISVFAGVVAFDEGGYTYQAIRKDGVWEMAAMDQMRVLEMLTVVAPADASPGVLLTAWWKAQKAAGTYSDKGP
jgi:hypothetical protein